MQISVLQVLMIIHATPQMARWAVVHTCVYRLEDLYTVVLAPRLEHLFLRLITKHVNVSTEYKGKEVRQAIKCLLNFSSFVYKYSTLGLLLSRRLILAWNAFSTSYCLHIACFRCSVIVSTKNATCLRSRRRWTATRLHGVETSVQWRDDCHRQIRWPIALQTATTPSTRDPLSLFTVFGTRRVPTYCEWSQWL